MTHHLSSVAFPSSSSSNPDRTSVYSVQSSISTNSNDSQLSPPPALPYLPFRRISLPTLPPQNLQHQYSPLRRQPTQPQQLQRSSIASFESLSESPESSPMGRHHVVPKNRLSISHHSHNSPGVTPRKGARRTAVSMQLGSKPSPTHKKSQGLASLPPNDPLLVKRRKVILELYETERAYVEGLDLIYQHFLHPILDSLETPTPILARPLLTAVFSNFIDIWNLHRAFFSELTRLFCPSSPVGWEQRRSETPPPSAVMPQLEDLSSIFPSVPPPLSPILLAHFPYLSMYTPFITAFPQILAALNTLLTPSSHHRLQPKVQTRAAAARAQSTPSSSAASPTKSTELKYEKRFADFVATQERDPKCGKLKLRDWLLTIVQRCPRYLLLLGDLLSCTPGETRLPLDEGKDSDEQTKQKMEKERSKWHREATKEEEREREKLIQVYSIVSKITTSLNTSIYSHTQTLSLLALQRSTVNLPLDGFQFISPGRTLLKRGTLLQIENPDARVKRGESKNSDMRPREREFLLFSDCLVWLANEETEKREKEWNFDWDLSSIWSSFAGNDAERPKSTALTSSSVAPVSAVPRDLQRPPMLRTRSKSEAEVTALQAKAAVASSKESFPSPNVPTQSKSALPHDVKVRRPAYKSNFSRINKNAAFHLHFHQRGRKNSSSSPTSAGFGFSSEQQWSYKGRIELVNLEIVIDTSVDLEEEDDEREIKWRWEVLSPEGSFVLYAASAKDLTEWTTLMRQAKSQQLVALNAQHPNSTLTSSEATHHIRRALQALPFAPNDMRMQEGLNKVNAVDQDHSGKDEERKRHKKSGSRDKKETQPAWHKERRSKVEHWVPAIWIPDEKAEGCMRCGRAFGWRRRRHHCRLCGRCVCSSCSEKTFYITDPNTKDGSSQAARACNACYESVFPLLDPLSEAEDGDESTVRARPQPPQSPPASSSFLPQSTSVLSYASTADTITSLSRLPPWMNMSVPSLALTNTSGIAVRSRSKSKDLTGPEALMAIDSNRYSYADGRRQSSGNVGRSGRDSGVVFDLDSSADEIAIEDLIEPARSGSRIKLRSQSSSGSRPKSYHEILEDFAAATSHLDQNRTSPVEEVGEDAICGLAYGDAEESSVLSSSSMTSSRRHTTINLSSSASSVSLSTSPPTSSGVFPSRDKRPSGRREDTIRRSKRYSIPAVALHTTSVVARTQSILPRGSPLKSEDMKRSKLSGNPNEPPGTRSKRFSLVLGGRHGHGNPVTRDERGSPSNKRITQSRADLGKGVAASKLSELLGRPK